MQTRPVIIIDEDIQDCAEVLHKMCTFLDEGINSYIDILNTVRNEAVKSGETANALSMFINQATKMQNCYEPLGSALELLLGNFEDEVDRADEYLY